MKICDRCQGAGGCLLDYMGKACKHWRKENAPEVLATMEDMIGGGLPRGAGQDLMHR